MNELNQIMEAVKAFGWPLTIGWLLYKQGILKLPFVKNGNGNDIKEMQENIKHLRAHFNDDLTIRLDKLSNKMDEHAQIERENSFYLQEIIKKLDNINRN